MKKILAIVLMLALVLSGALAEEPAAMFAPDYSAEPWSEAVPGEMLGFELLRDLYASGENRVISPISLSLALGMAAEGAQGATLDEILSALDAEDAASISTVLPEGLKSANAAFVAPGLVLKEEYIDRLNEGYAAQWFEIDGEVVRKVNTWVQENTDGLIDQMLSQAPAGDTGMILLNAVAMDADWAYPFTPEATTQDAFHAPGGDVQVQMMHQTEYLYYAEKDGVQIVRLPYRDGGLEMWIAMPEAGGMEALLEKLASGGMSYLNDDAVLSQVTLSLPKMDISDENTLSDALKLLGVETAFSDEADFSGISDTPLCVDEILQKARVQVDEMGTRAAAATAMIMKLLSGRPVNQMVEMRVDRPFAFVISDSETGSVCFAGIVENPAKG